MDAIRNFWTMHFSWLQLPTLSIRWTDILEIIILSFFIYPFSDLGSPDPDLGSVERPSGAGVFRLSGVYFLRWTPSNF